MLSTAHRRAILMELLAIDTRLAELHDCHVVNGDPAEHEATLLILQDALDWRLGIDYFDRRDSVADG